LGPRIFGTKDRVGPSPTLFHKKIVGIAIHPIFIRLEGFDDRVAGTMKVFGGVLIFRLIAATDVTATHAESQVNPGVAHFQTFLAAIGSARFNIFDLIEMPAVRCHNLSVFYSNDKL
jgi:hypothetical protein